MRKTVLNERTTLYTNKDNTKTIIRFKDHPYKMCRNTEGRSYELALFMLGYISLNSFYKNKSSVEVGQVTSAQDNEVTQLIKVA